MPKYRKKDGTIVSFTKPVPKFAIVLFLLIFFYLVVHGVLLFPTNV